MAHPNPANWKKYEETLSAGVRGFNHMTALPKMLRKEYPWAKRFTFGFCSESDLPEWSTLGWEHVEPEHLDIESFNSAVPLRFGLTAPAGLVKYRENYLMMMAKDFRERQVEMRNRAAAEIYSSQTEARPYVSPQDPRGEELRAADSTSESTTAVIAPTSAQPKKRGRPRKTN